MNTLDIATQHLQAAGIGYRTDGRALIVRISATETVRIYSLDSEGELTIARSDGRGHPTGSRITLTNEPRMIGATINLMLG